MILGIVIGIVVVVVAVGIVFVNQPSFGRLPQGERLERIKSSPHYKNGAFENLSPTTLMTSDKGRLQGLWEFVFAKKDGLVPDKPIPVIKTDLK